MKRIFAVLLILLTSNSFATNIVKVFDGTSATCERQADIWDFRFQVHLVTSVKSQIDGDDINIEVKSEMLSCQKNTDGYNFVKKNLFDNFSYNIVSGLDQNQEPILDKVTVSTIAAKLIMFKDSNYELVSSTNINPSTTPVNNISVTLPLSNLLSKEELVKYNNGEVILKELDLFLKREFNLDSSDSTIKYSQSYGSHRTTLSISK